MTGRLLLVLVLLAIHLVDGGADPIPEPCHKTEARDSPVWKLLCEQLMKSISRRNATEVAGDAKTLKGSVEGVGSQTAEPKKTVVNVKVLDESSPQESNSVNSRQHKAFFVDYPASQRVYQDKSSVRKKQQQQQKKQPGKSKNKKPESEIFFIRLPPTPYSYVPGLGYISQPPSFSTASLAGSVKPQRNPFIKLPIDFVSNGKPTAVYRWPPPSPPSKQKPSKTHHQKYRPDSPIIKLNRGPYIFDGRPKSVYLMKRNPTRPNRF